MAEAIFNALIDDMGFPFRAESAGVAALKGEPMLPNAGAALEEIGIYTEDHRAKQVNETMIEEADLMLTMTPRHIAELRRLFGNLPREVYTLLEYATGTSSEEGISDPYGNTMTAYRACVRQLLEGVSRVVDGLGRR